MWINHAFYLIRLISATWIVCGWIWTRTTVEVIVEATAGEIRTICVHRDGLWHNTCALLWNLFHQFTTEGPRFLHHEASRTFLASDPVVDVTLDKEFFSNGAPQSKVHGFIMCLAQWNCGGHSCVSIGRCPCRPWSDSVCARREAWISCEGITPDQSPASSLSLLVAIGLKSVAMGTRIRVNPVDAWRGRRHFCLEILAIECWRIFWQTCVYKENDHLKMRFFSESACQQPSFPSPQLPLKKGKMDKIIFRLGSEFTQRLLSVVSHWRRRKTFWVDYCSIVSRFFDILSSLRKLNLIPLIHELTSFSYLVGVTHQWNSSARFTWKILWSYTNWIKI